MGGISASIVTLPVALAYGVASGLGAMAGMYTAVVLGFFAASFGGTNTQISSPTGAMTVVVALIIAQEVTLSGNINSAMPIIILIFILTGVIQMLLGLFKLGLNIRYVPYTVVSGFMSGIGIIIIVLQVKDVFGVYDSNYRSVSQILWHLPYFATHIHWQSFFLAGATLLIIFFFPRLTKRLPGSLVALVVVTGISYLLNMDVSRLGMIEISFAHFDLSFDNQIFETTTLLRIVLSAISLAILGSINALLSSVVADKMTHTIHDSNKELFGQGLGNFLVAFIGGFPGSGATACTVANIQSGGKNKFSGVIGSLFLLLILLFGTPIAAQIPHAVLGGILVYIGYVLIDKETLRGMKKIPKADNLVMVTVLVLTIFWNLLYAVIIGLVFASFYFMKKMADVVEVDSAKNKVDKIIDQVIESFDDAKEFQKQVLIKSIRGPVFFGFSSRFLVSMRNISPEVKAVVFNMSLVPYMDHSGVRTFMEVVEHLHKKGVNVCFSELSNTNIRMLREFKVIPTYVDENHIFDSVEECIMWLHEPGHIYNQFAADNELYFPPAFTPNGDGINDEWKIKNIKKYPNARLSIFDLNDHKVFESQDNDKPWNGQLNGELLPPGKYTYIVELNSENEKPRTGSVFIFR
ncbi:MAG: SulP family inorganic anion transporter [Cyclobacteriaceae bacterium]